MKKFFTIPESIDVSIEKYAILLKGNSSQLILEIPDTICVAYNNKQILVSTEHNLKGSARKRSGGLFGTFCSNLKNNIKGIHTGFNKQLNLVGVGYRAEKTKEGQLSLKVGYSHPITIKEENGVYFEVTKANVIQVNGNNLQRVTQKAADIRKFRPPEPYKGKGILFKKERILRKEGKKVG
jgi:large subunit ribosomal protein L6